MTDERLTSDAAADRTAERLVAALCSVPLAAWREAALKAPAPSRASSAIAALDTASPSCEPLRAWWIRDDLETALYRLTAREARGVVQGPVECEWIRAATRRAVSALLCSTNLAPADVRTLAEPFLGLL